MSGFSETGEAKVLKLLVESRIVSQQNSDDKQMSGNAITRELNSLTPQQLHSTIAEFNKMTKGGWQWTDASAAEKKNLNGESFVEFTPLSPGWSVQFTPMPNLRNTTESFNIDLKNSTESATDTGNVLTAVMDNRQRL